MRRTRKYFFSILMLCSSIGCFGQETLDDDLPQRQVFVRVGCDVSRFALPYVRNNGSKGMEFSVDGEIAYNFFPIAEYGLQSLSRNTDSLSYKMSGNYLRVGLDYNLIKYKHRLDRDIFYIGLRFAGTRFSHEAPYAALNSVWGVVESNIPRVNMNALWGEAVVGLKGELFKNFYIGIAARAKMMFSHTAYNSMVPYIVPGYGKGFNRFNAGFTYSLMYAIPIRGAGPDGYEVIGD